MHKEICQNRKVEFSTVDELFRQPIKTGDIIGISDNGNPITWDYYFVVSMTQDDGGLTTSLLLGRDPNGTTGIELEHGVEGENSFYIHISMQEVRDTWVAPRGQMSIADMVTAIYTLSHKEVGWTTRSLESILEESNGRFTRAQLTHYIEQNQRLFRRLLDGRYEYLPLSNPDLLHPVNRRGRVAPAGQGQPLPSPREPLDLRPPRNINPARANNHRM